MGSLLNQFYRPIEDNFRPNLNKRSYKKQGNSKVLIASYEYKRSLVKFAGNYSKFLEEQGIHNIKDIKAEHTNSFLQSKINKDCSRRTIVQYKSYLRTLDKLIKQTYHFNSHLSDGIVVNGGTSPKRNLYMKDEHLEAIFDLKKDSNDPALLGLEIASCFGLRASEIVFLRGKDFDINSGYLKVFKGKNGKTRYLKINTDEKADLVCRIKETFEDEEKVVPIKVTQYYKFLREALAELNITEYKEAKTSNHSLRKRFAIHEEKLYESMGMTKEEALKETSLGLGHNRTSVTNGYLNSK